MARINSLTITGPQRAGGVVTLQVDVEVEAFQDGTYRLETNLKRPLQ